MSTVLVTPARKGMATHRGRSGGGGSGRSEHNHHFDTLGAIAITQRITFLLLDRRESWLLHDCPLLRGVWARRGDPCSRNWLAQERELTFFKICDNAGDCVCDRHMNGCFARRLACVPAATDTWSRCTLQSVRASQANDVHRGVNLVNRERKLSAIAALSSRLKFCRPIAIRFLRTGIFSRSQRYQCPHCASFRA
jgi:hypothetical protein